MEKVEVIQKDIPQLREGDKILVEVTFGHVFNGELAAWCKSPFRGEALLWIDPEKYRGVPVRPIVKGDTFVWKSTGETLEIHAIKDGICYGFFQSTPDQIMTTDGSTLRLAGWERIE